MSALPIGEEPTTGAEPEPPPSSDAWSGGWPQSPGEFAVLVDLYLHRLVCYAFRRLGNVHDAEDVVQEVFLRAYSERAERKHVTRPGPYLYRMVANACTDLLRKHRAVIVSVDDIEADQIGSGGRNPAEAAIAAEELRRAEDLVRQLPDAQAEVVRLRVFDELRLHEIAEILGCSVDTVSSRLRYGFEKLRKIVLRKRGDGNGLPTSSTLSR
jgi:RNA polymerase sigma-70 factor (ECF subfamily)